MTVLLYCTSPWSFGYSANLYSQSRGSIPLPQRLYCITIRNWEIMSICISNFSNNTHIGFFSLGYEHINGHSSWYCYLCIFIVIKGNWVLGNYVEVSWVFPYCWNMTIGGFWTDTAEHGGICALDLWSSNDWISVVKSFIVIGAVSDHSCFVILVER